MEKSLLILILRSCTKKEYRELRKWLDSPMHNQRPDVVLLFNYLLESNHLYNDDSLKKKVAYRWVFGKEKFDDAKLRQTMFFTTKCVENYLIYQELHLDEVRAHTALANVYRKRKLSKLFQKNMRLTQKLQQNQHYRNGDFLHNEYQIRQADYRYLSGQKRTVPLNLQEMSNALDSTYLADKLRQSCLMLAHQSVFTTEYEIGMLDEVLQYVETKNFLKIPAIAIYYYSYKAITEQEDETYFRHLRHEIIENGHFFPKSEIRDIYLLAINYCIRRINEGKDEYIRESFELYRTGLEQKILLDEGILSRHTFTNVVTNGTMLKEFEWTENFITEYKSYLENQYRDNNVHYSLARLHFEKGDYETSMKLFSQMEYDDIFMNLNAKVMQFKMFYEQEELDVLESLLESMRNYLVRKKVIGYHKSNYKNIIRFTKKLLKINPYSQVQRGKLLNEIEEANPLTERKWLLKQLKNL